MLVPIVACTLSEKPLFCRSGSSLLKEYWTVSQSVPAGTPALPGHAVNVAPGGETKNAFVVGTLSVAV